MLPRIPGSKLGPATKENESIHANGSHIIDNNTILAMATKLSNLTRDLESTKENNMKLVHEITNMKQQMQNEQLTFMAANQEIRSVVSAEITARRKGYKQMQGSLENFSMIQNDVMSSFRREISSLVDEVGSKLSIAEKNVSIMTNRVLSEVDEIREYSKKSIANLSNDFYDIKRSVGSLKEHPHDGGGEKLSQFKVGSYQFKIHPIFKSLLLNTYLSQYSTRYNQAEIEEVRTSIDADLRLVRSYVDETKQSVLKDIAKQVVSIVSKVEQTLIAYESKADENLKSVISHISEEISTVVTEESDKRAAAISDAENKVQKTVDGISIICSTLREEMLLVAKTAAKGVNNEKADRIDSVRKIIELMGKNIDDDDAVNFENNILQIPGITGNLNSLKYSEAPKQLEVLNTQQNGPIEKEMNVKLSETDNAVMAEEDEAALAKGATMIQAQMRKKSAMKKVESMKAEKAAAEPAMADAVMAEEDEAALAKGATMIQAQMRKKSAMKKVESMKAEKAAAEPANA